MQRYSISYVFTGCGISILQGSYYRTWIRRIGFFLASAAVPILANAVRVFGIVFLAYVSGNRIARGVDHIIYGWIFFAVVMALLLVVGGWWREKPDQHGDVTASPATNVNETERRNRNVNVPQRQPLPLPVAVS